MTSAQILNVHLETADKKAVNSGWQWGNFRWDYWHITARLILKSLITNESFDARYFGIVNYYEYLYVYGRMAVY